MYLIAGLLLISLFVTTTNVNAEINQSVDHIIEDGIEIHTNYAMSDDFGDDWKITGNKAIDIALSVDEQPNDIILKVEHMHIDIFIESEYASFDDMIQDSMDDYKHASMDGGFFVNETYSYYETFSIEGSSPSFQASMQNAWLYGDFMGSIFGDETDFKFSEEVLVNDYKVYGETIYVVFDITIEHDYNGDGIGDDPCAHKVVFTDNMFIDLDGNIVENTGNTLDRESDTIPGYALWILIPCIALSVIILSKKVKKRIN